MECSKILFLEKQKYNKINNSFENNDDKNIKIDIKKNEKEKEKIHSCCKLKTLLFNLFLYIKT